MQTQDTNTAVAPIPTHCDLFVLTYAKVATCRAIPTIFVRFYMLLDQRILQDLSVAIH